MIRVGMIGGIGSGKSFLAKLFRCPVFNADKEVEAIYKKNKNCFKKLKKKLPNFIKNFPIRKKEMISAINANKNNLKKISSVVHPIVRQQMRKFIKKNRNAKMIILDIPLLVENKLNKPGDILIFVKAKKYKILERIKKRKNFNKEIVKKLKNNQTALFTKMKLSNFVVDNSFPPSIMNKKIKLLKNKILDERNST